MPSWHNRSKLQLYHSMLEILFNNEMKEFVDVRDSGITALTYNLANINGAYMGGIFDEMIAANLIKRHTDTNNFRKWFTITDKGQELLGYLTDLFELIPELK